MEYKEPSTSSNPATEEEGDPPAKNRRAELSECTKIEEMVTNILILVNKNMCSNHNNNFQDTKAQAELLIQISTHMLQMNSTAFFDAFKVINSMADQFSLSGNGSATINPDFILRYPLPDHESMYRRIGTETRTLTVSNIPWEQARSVFPFFKNIHTLVVEKMEIIEDNFHAFPPVRSLKFSQCRSECVISHWSLGGSLESLHFDRVTCEKVGSPEYSVRDSPIRLKRLRHLTLEGTDDKHGQPFIFIYAHILETLTICGGRNIHLCAMRNLRRLTLDSVNSLPLMAIDIHLPSLEFLSVRGAFMDKFFKEVPFPAFLKTIECYSAPVNIKKILKLNNLQHAKIHCNWYHKEELKRHFASLSSMKSYEVTSYYPPIEGYNILDTLNADCLRKMFRYLPRSDLISITCADPKFIFIMPSLIIEPKFLETYPPQNSEFYEDIGNRVDKLIVNEISREEIESITKHFPHLQSLSIEELELDLDFDSVIYDMHFKKLEHLTMRTSDWFQSSLLDELKIDNLVSLALTQVDPSWNYCRSLILKRLSQFPTLETLLLEIKSGWLVDTSNTDKLEKQIQSEFARGRNNRITLMVERTGPQSLLLTRLNKYKLRVFV